jgi:hypothetical protein
VRSVVATGRFMKGAEIFIIIQVKSNRTRI